MMGRQGGHAPEVTYVRSSDEGNSCKKGKQILEKEFAPNPVREGSNKGTVPTSSCKVTNEMIKTFSNA